MSIKLYSLILSGVGDTCYYIVNKDVYDWVMNPNDGRPANAANKTTYWMDTLVPQSVLQQMWDQIKPNVQASTYKNNINNLKVGLTSGSWGNDRAMCAPPAVINGKKCLFFNLKDFLVFCKTHDIEIEDTYEGCVY